MADDREIDHAAAGEVEATDAGEEGGEPEVAVAAPEGDVQQPISDEPMPAAPAPEEEVAEVAAAESSEGGGEKPEEEPGPPTVEEPEDEDDEEIEPVPWHEGVMEDLGGCLEVVEEGGPGPSADYVSTIAAQALTSIVPGKDCDAFADQLEQLGEIVVDEFVELVQGAIKSLRRRAKAAVHEAEAAAEKSAEQPTAEAEAGETPAGSHPDDPVKWGALASDDGEKTDVSEPQAPAEGSETTEHADAGDNPQGDGR